MASGAADCVLALGFEQMSPGALGTVFTDRPSPLDRFEKATDELVGNGQVPLALSAYTHIVDDQKSRGAPIDSFVIEPQIGRVNGIGISRRPPHPNAARLFYEYNLIESQPLMVKMHYVSPVSKLASGPKMVFVDIGMDPAQVERCDAAYDMLIKGRK